jgi:hypothetical protein
VGEDGMILQLQEQLGNENKRVDGTAGINSLKPSGHYIYRQV